MMMRCLALFLCLLSLSNGAAPPLERSGRPGRTTEAAETPASGEETTTAAEATTTVGVSSAATGPSCAYPDHYCNPTANDLIRKVEDEPITSAKHCEDRCKSYTGPGAPCHDFTYFNFRGIKTCFLLKGCSDKRPKCTVAASCVSGGTPPDCMPKDTCDMLSEDNIENHMRWRCQGGINPYKEKIPAGIPCYTYCPGWVNTNGKNFVVKSICVGTGDGAAQWGEPKYFPPGDPLHPVELSKPTTPIPQCACSDLKLPYNPNEERGAMFYCDDKTIEWDAAIAAGGVRINTTDRCHLFCDKMLISITECKDGVWAGRPDLGYWCNTKPEPDVTNWDEQHGDIKIKESNKPRKSHQQAAEGDYQVGAKHHSNNFYDGGDDENLNGASHEK